jgi:hypothetical protein
MSQATAADVADLDIREQIVRIDRSIAETRKFQAETNKLKADRWIAPFLAGGTFIVAVGGLVTGILSLLKLTGHG